MATGIFKLRDQLLGLVQKAWTGSQTTPAVEYLVVAGGGGGNYLGGGGGAGGLLQGILPVTNGATLTVTVGGGGASATSGVNSVFGSVNAIAGGAGGASSSSNPGLSGGSGGGANVTGGGGTTIIFGQGVAGQGNAGGLSYSGSNYTGGGGGGAGTVGLSAIVTAAGNGGAGIASAISGTVTTYAGGGGGPADSSGTGGLGGVGGGGAGGVSRGATGGSGTVNGVSGTTGGGGGGYGVAGTGGSGGSGICIISYPDTYNAPTTLTGTYTASTSGSGSLSFNGSTQYVVGPTTSALNIGTGNFTVEFWVYPTAIYASVLSIFFSCSNSATDFQISLSAANYLNWYNGAPIITNAGTPTSCPLNQWNHIVLVRSGTNCALFCNGVRFGTATNSSAINLTNYYLGSYWNGAPNYLTYGYMSNVRVSNAAIYSPTSSTLTTPTVPFTATSSTVLLMSTVSGAQFADSSASSLTNSVGVAPTWNQLSPFATGLGYKNRVYTWTANGTVTF